MTAGEQIAGVATYGYPRTTRRPVQLTPKAARCVCGADPVTETCPQNCPTREDASR